MSRHRLARRFSPLVVVTLLTVAPALDTHAESTSQGNVTIWDTVRAGASQMVTTCGGALHSLYAWVSGIGGSGGSRLADDLVSFSSKDLRDLELLVESAGYHLDDVNIHLGSPGDVTLSFSYQHAIDPKRASELRDVVSSDNALVDTDSRTIVSALLDASARADSRSADNFRFHRVYVRLGSPPQVISDFQTRKAGAFNEPALFDATQLATAIPALVAVAAAATPETPFNAVPASLVLSTKGDAPLVVADGTSSVQPKPPMDMIGAPDATKSCERLPTPIATPAPEAPRTPEPVGEGPKLEQKPAAPEAPKTPEPVNDAPKLEQKPAAPEAPKTPEPVSDAPKLEQKPAAPEAPKTAVPLTEPPKPAESSQAAGGEEVFRVTLSHVNGRHGPGTTSEVVRQVTPEQLLTKTGKSEGNWAEYAVVGETGPAARVWIHATVVKPVTK